MSLTQGIHHVGLTTQNVEDTTQFFTELLGFDIVNRNPDYPAIFISDGTSMITLWEAQDAENSIPFNRKLHIGLHHLALKVETLSKLNDIHQTLKENNVSIEFAPGTVGDGPAHHMMFTEPGGIRIELFTNNS